MHLQRKNQKNQKKLKRKNLKKKNGKPFFINFSSFFLNFSECLCIGAGNTLVKPLKARFAEFRFAAITVFL
jgi:hypothetical protein